MNKTVTELESELKVLYARKSELIKCSESKEFEDIEHEIIQIENLIFKFR